MYVSPKLSHNILEFLNKTNLLNKILTTDVTVLVIENANINKKKK